jgi:hypothetical protein
MRDGEEYSASWLVRQVVHSRPRDRPAHHATMHTELRRHPRNRADPKLMLPTELLEQIHFGFPVHKRHPDLIGLTVG